MPLTKINFSTAAAETIGNLPDSSKVTNVDNDTRFLVVEDEKTKFTTLDKINAGVNSTVSTLSEAVTSLDSRASRHERELTALGESISDTVLGGQDWATEPFIQATDTPEIDNIAFVIHNLDTGIGSSEYNEFCTIEEIRVGQNYTSDNYDKKPVFMALHVAPIITSGIDISAFKFLGCSLNKQTPEAGGDDLKFYFPNLKFDNTACSLLIFFVETPDKAKTIPSLDENFDGIKMATRPGWGNNLSSIHSYFYKIDGTIISEGREEYIPGHSNSIRYPIYITGQHFREYLRDHKYSYKHVSLDERNQIKEGYERSIDAQSTAIRTENKLNSSVSSINGSIDNIRLGLGTANANIAALDTQFSTLVNELRYVNEDISDINTNISTIESTATSHAGTFASTSAAGHVFLASDINDTGNNAVPIASQVKSSLTSLETNLNTHKNTAATASAYGHVKLGTGVQVANDAGMVGICSNGGLGVRKASSNNTSGVGCVKLAVSLDDTGDVAVPTASQVNAAINGADKRLLPADTTLAEGEWQALHIPYTLLPSWPIERITIPTMLNVQATPLYMAAYSVSSSGAISHLSVSSNALTWEANSSATWNFETPISLQSGYNLRLFLITDIANATETACTAISEHVKSHYISGGSCEVRYSGVWYGTRTIDIIFSSNGHADILSTTSSPGHVYLATDENDTRDNTVPTIAQFKALLDRVAALETALASVTLVTAPETTA